jgi:radical SAM-linked protein
MPRLLFEKVGRSVWISHLDLMRLFQRAFKRAGLKLKHTQGFNPRPSVSIALPLSVGVESECELLDFDLEGESMSNEQICNLLNEALVEGVKVKSVYDGGKKIGALSLLQCQIIMEYNNNIPEDAHEQIQTLFTKESLVLPKKTKSGIQEQDIIPMIKRISTRAVNQHTIVMDALICCQNPTLNPAQLTLAVETFLPTLCPDLVKCRRMEIYDINETVFR